MGTLANPPALVLVVAPTGSDGRNISEVLRGAGFRAEACPSVAAAAERCDDDSGALVLAEEALQPTERDPLAAALGRQPPWSDLPIVLITVTRHSAQAGNPLQRMGLQGNITLLERPLHAATLIATVDVALRSRRRQFELRDLLAERESLLVSLEQRVAERTNKLQAMVAEMEAFSYSVSHDLRSPLRVLAGYASVLREDHAERLDAEGLSYLQKIAVAAERMDRLTQDLLAYTRIAGAELALSPVNLDEIMQSVIETYPSLRDAKSQIVALRPLGWVLGHSPSLVQCLSNLLDNALKFSPPGSDPVTVTARRAAGRLRCCISDQGPGIAPEDHERIFGLFERGPDKRVPGTGIGLAIVKKAVERMQGTVGVDSAPGRGTTIWFELTEAPPNEARA